MENFVEIVIEKKMNAMDRIKWFVATFIPLMIGTFLVFAVGGPFKILAVLVCAGLYYLGYKIFNSFYIEWEYTLVSNEIYFAKIVNKIRRKDILTLDIPKTEVMAKISDAQHKSQRECGAKHYSFISQTNNDYYFVVGYDKDGNKVCVDFEPDDRIIEVFKTLALSKVF